MWFYIIISMSIMIILPVRTTASRGLKFFAATLCVSVSGQPVSVKAFVRADHRRVGNNLSLYRSIPISLSLNMRNVTFLFARLNILVVKPNFESIAGADLRLCLFTVFNSCVNRALYRAE